LVWVPNIYFSADQQDMEKINLMVQRFWETENIAVENVPVFKVNEKTALDVAEGSITYNEGH